ncbi:MAG: hypothetical protein HN712_13250 [Gemmatimonadetes bacterium]|jgi:neutral ceramidase|nr:hypothetical protein [Gemmatimonadota bacterium]MBT6147311.1 hypothetical protein [Gemmatimonadota bacterium]MBT7861281.1 hypothetical protein [Gemmatimonadota bacterium]
MRSESWRVGFAEADITPENNEAFLSGFGRPRLATGKLAPLVTQALVLEDANERRAVLVTADVTGFDRTTVDAVRYRLERDFAIEPAAVMLAASHTHFGPGVQLQNQWFCGMASPWYMARFEQMICDTVGRAVRDLSRAKLRYTAADTAIGCNRRVHDATGHVKTGMAPNLDGCYDRHTPVWLAQRRGPKSDIVVVGHACHPTSVGVLDKWSPDYPGAMRRALTRKRGVHGMFVMGAGGAAKVCHVDRQTGETVFTADPRHSAAAGRKLAQAALVQLDEGELTELPPTLSCAVASGR